MLEIIPYRLCGCTYFNGSPFQSLAIAAGVHYHAYCLSRDHMLYIDGLEPTKEEEAAPCANKHFPFLYGVEGIRLSVGEIETLLGNRIRKAAQAYEATSILASML